jgi:FkbM family methyltransferase
LAARLSVKQRMKKQLRKLIGALGYEVRGTRYTPRPLLEPANVRCIELDDLLCRQMIETRRELTFIQVGAYDGITRDPLCKYVERYGWRGVMLEPQAMAAGQLRALYQNNDSVVVLQAALDRLPGSATLYTVDFGEREPRWTGGLASFHRDCILKHRDLIPGLEGMIRCEKLTCVTFDDVLTRLPTEPLDLLQVDTEGADAHILSLFPFERVKPAIIHWEVKHLSMTDRTTCLARLAELGYRFARSGEEDMVAVLD